MVERECSAPKSIHIWVWFALASLLLGLLVALLAGILPIRAPIHTDVPLDEFKAYMDEHIPVLMKRFAIPGCSISLVKNSEIVCNQAYGYADLESQRSLTIDTPMSVQSITKSLTAWGTLKLVEKGSLDLDTPASKYLKNWQFPQTEYPVERITIRSLLNHTAGLPLGDFTDVYAPGENMPSLQEKLTKEAVVMRDPRTKFFYSNVGYHVLERIIEEVTGYQFAEYMHSEVLLPLGMETSTFEISKTMKQYPPTGYNLKGKPVPVYVYPEKSSGGLFATAEDIARFAVASITAYSGSNGEYVRMMYAPETHKIGVYGLVFDAYGFGHYRETLPNGLLSVSHGGQGNGIMTHLQIVPETGDALVILTNSQRSWPFIAHVLGDWAQWRGFPSVGMGRIIWGQYAMSGLIGMLLAASLVIVLKTASRCAQQPSARIKALKILIAMLLLGICIWSASQEYLFVTSVFPVLSLWLGIAVLVFSGTLLSTALIPDILRERTSIA